MKKYTLFLLMLITSYYSFAQQNILFDDSWKFYKGGVLGGQKNDLDDSKWRTVDLPHDWSIEDLPGTNSPFNADAISQVSGGFTTGGTGWYRKHFRPALSDSGKVFTIQFDGVYMNADVWINGELLGNHPYGYTEFSFNISNKIKFNTDNIIAVEVKNEGVTSRWYSGSGIYRHVWLQASSVVHVTNNGVSITSKVNTNNTALINIQTEVSNTLHQIAYITLKTKIVNDKGVEVGSNNELYDIQASSVYNFQEDLQLQNPELWSI